MVVDQQAVPVGIKEGDGAACPLVGSELDHDTITRRDRAEVVHVHVV